MKALKQSIRILVLFACLGIEPFKVYGKVVDLSLLINPKVGISCIEEGELREILNGYQSRWNGNGSIRLVVIKGDESFEEVINSIVRKSSSQFFSHWRRLVFTGRGVMPVVFASKAEALEYLKKTPNALGCFSMDEAMAGVKPLKLCEE